MTSHRWSAFVSTALQLIEAKMLRSNIVAEIRARDLIGSPDGRWIGRATGGSVMSTTLFLPIRAGHYSRTKRDQIPQHSFRRGQYFQARMMVGKMAALISSKEIERTVRAALEKQGHSISAERGYGETGTDIVAQRGEEVLHIEAIAFKQSPPARARRTRASIWERNQRNLLDHERL